MKNLLKNYLNYIDIDNVSKCMFCFNINDDSKLLVNPNTLEKFTLCYDCYDNEKED